jgi:hypothetical protein
MSLISFFLYCVLCEFYNSNYSVWNQYFLSRSPKLIEVICPLTKQDLFMKVIYTLW